MYFDWLKAVPSDWDSLFGCIFSYKAYGFNCFNFSNFFKIFKFSNFFNFPIRES